MRLCSVSHRNGGQRVNWCDPISGLAKKTKAGLLEPDSITLRYAFRFCSTPVWAWAS
jgi:hypothetical protein